MQAYFSDIRAVIAAELHAARRRISAAVAWLTDPHLIEPLLHAARRGCAVEIALLDDAINRRAAANLERLAAAGVRVYWIPAAAGGGGSLHHKFCVLDETTVITGSYNWTHRARQAEENILVARGDAALAQGYQEAFERLLVKYQHRPAAPALDTPQVLRRLEVIRHLLLLEDYETVAAQWPRLEGARGLPPVAEILERLRGADWATAETLIAAVLARGLALAVYQDPVVAELRLELLTLEAQIVALSGEQAELERQIQQFAQRQHQELGELLGDCLRLRREYWERQARRSRRPEDRAAADAAHAEQADYQQAHEAFAHAPRTATLDAEQQRELKRLYREAAMRSHPDRVTEEDRAAAHAVFVQVQQAYQQGDLATLGRLHRRLTEGRPFADPATVYTEADQLRRRLDQLRLEVELRLTDLRGLRASETYQTLAAHADWDAYFADVRRRLAEECADLRRKLEEEDDE
jgi:hypothetical protein